MDCEQVQFYIIDFIDNELPAMLYQEIDEHLTGCIACKRTVEEYRKTALLLQLRSVPDPGEAYFESTWESIREGMRARTLALPARTYLPAPTRWVDWMTRRPLRLLATAAAIILICLAGYHWAQNLQESDEYVDNDTTYQVYLPKDWQPERPDFGIVPAHFKPEVQFSAYSKAAIGGIDPISKSAVIWKVQEASR